ncbi:methylthioribose kinase [Metabacillus herbersteinensis]|uniref:Methylthioribose kinase n=1 Tax=Metabacillus herbersteinensis TaxID=283816 RepID=A0ABV6GC64_9BACI
MIQRFIELGEGYSDLYELIETAKANKNRVAKLLALHTNINNKSVTSVVVVMKPTDPGKFQAMYISREGIPNPHVKENKRFLLFQELATFLEKEIIQIDVKPSSTFNEKDLYYQYLTGIFRLNHYIPPLQ